MVDEGDTDVGTVTATDLQAVTFTISGSVLAITAEGVVTFIAPADYEGEYITDDASTLDYGGATVDVTATVTATDESLNAETQVITVSINDVGGIDDNNATGTGTGTNTLGAESATATATATTATATATATTATATATSTGTGTGTGTGT